MNGKAVFKEMSPYKPGKQIQDVKLEYGLERIVKLASNENPFGFSDHVKAVWPELSESLEIYPDGYATLLRQELAMELNVQEEQLVFGSGSDEVVEFICRTFLEQGMNTIMAKPTFPQYKHNALIEGAEIREVPLIDGYHDLEGMLDRVDGETKVIWLCTPNNPTGSLIHRENFEQFMEQCPDHVLVVMDEAYYEYVETDDYPQTIKALEKYKNLIVLRTFSKAYGLAGLRVGYGVADEAITTLLNITRGPFNTTSVAQKAALVALKDKEFLQTSLDKNKQNKNAFMRFCEEQRLPYYDSEANFLFVKLPVSGDTMFEYLLSKGFIVRSGEALGHPGGVRITIGERKDMEELQQHIRNFLVALAEEKQL